MLNSHGIVEETTYTPKTLKSHQSKTTQNVRALSTEPWPQRWISEGICVPFLPRMKRHVNIVLKNSKSDFWTLALSPSVNTDVEKQDFQTGIRRSRQL